MQKVTFPDQSFAIHKVQIAESKNKISAWYNVHGSLIDAEYVLPNGLTRNIDTRHKQVIGSLESIGRTHSV